MPVFKHYQPIGFTNKNLCSFHNHQLSHLSIDWEVETIKEQ
jgi:hypothetical protein